jgi:hypothetical protein
MERNIDQLPLAQRIPALVEAVTAARQRKEAGASEEADWMDQLAKAEAEVTGKAAGSEGVELSGLIPDNPYAPKPSDDQDAAT